MSHGTDPTRTTPPPLPLRVLVVEDHAIGRILLEAMLSAIGIHAALASTGEEARAAMAKARFDVVLIDLGLPDVQGEDLARDLARRAGDAPVAFVAVTGRSRPTTLPAVFADWLEKPFSVADLHRLLVEPGARATRTA